jgi:hypothetical protein
MSIAFLPGTARVWLQYLTGTYRFISPSIVFSIEVLLLNLAHSPSAHQTWHLVGWSNPPITNLGFMAKSTESA